MAKERYRQRRAQEALWLFLAIFASTPTVAVGRVEYPLLPWEDIWEEVEKMTVNKTDCLPKSSTCWFSKNGTVTSTNGSSAQCSCDDECVKYGDCCWDKAQSDWGDGREEGSGRYNCHKIQTMGFIGLLMVDSCLPEYSNQPVERFCTRQVSAQEYSYLLDVPVTSRDTNTTYLNYQCAFCNNDSKHLHNWTVTINCRNTQFLKEFTMVEFMSKAQYIPGRRLWKRYIYRSPENERHSIFQERHDCTLEVEEFRSPESFIENYGGRLCIFPKGVCIKKFVGRGHCKEQVRQCDPTWPDDLDSEKCRRYSKMVQYTEANNLVTIYKNPHCARCNFVNTSSNGLKCIDPDVDSDSQRAGPNFLPCFSILMDFKGEKCKNINELWDPIHLACKRIYCGQLYKLENGICVRDPTYYHSLENSTLLDHSCPKMELFENDYIPRPDGSVFVNSSKKVYKKGEYEMLKEGTILICNDHRYYTTAFTTTHQLLTLIVLVISLGCLGLHMIIYLLVPRFRNLPGKTLFSLSCCLFIAHLIFLTGITATYNYGLCVFLSATLHFFWLASFCWMNIMSVDVCRTFTSMVYRGNADGHRNYMYYSIYAWSIPTLVVALSLIFNYTDILPEYKPDYATQLCWMNNLYGLALFFLLPVGAIVLENTILFFVTSCRIYKQAKAAKYANTRSQSVKGGHEPKAVKKMKYEKIHKQSTHINALQGRGSKKERVRLVLYLKLGLIQGITWILGFVAAFSDEPYMWYSFTVLNGLQGAFIFIAFDMKKKVGELVWQAVIGQPWKKHRKSKETRTTTVSQSSSSRNRSSKSDSDSDGESSIESIKDQLKSGEGLNWQAMKGVSLSGTVKLRPSMCAQSKASPQKTSRHKTSTNTDLLQGPSHTGSLKSPPDPVKLEELSVGQVGVRNGDLRANVVKGKFEDEGKDDTLGHQPQIGLEDNYISLKLHSQDLSKHLNIHQNNKPNLQHIVDLLQQLQQSKNTEDLPDVVQQLLKRCRGPVGDGQKKSATLSKCKSISEGVCSNLQEEQDKALKAKLQMVNCVKQNPSIHSLITSPTTTPAHETQHPPAVTSGPSNCAQSSGCSHKGFPLLPSHLPTQQCRRPKSLSSIANTSCDTSLWSPTKHQMTQVLSDDDEELIQIHMKQEKTHEAVHPLQRTLKSHSFSQISQVALVAAIMQRAASDAQERNHHNKEETVGYGAENRKLLNHHVINQGRTSESLV